MEAGGRSLGASQKPGSIRFANANAQVDTYAANDADAQVDSYSTIDAGE